MSQSGPPADAKQAQAIALQEIEAAQKRKRAIDTSLANLEASIFAFEGSYLEDTAASGGNIIKGFDNYLKPPTSGINKKKLEVTENDRLFSTSSGTYQQSLEAKRQHDLDLLALRQRQAIYARTPSIASYPHPALPWTNSSFPVNPRIHPGVQVNHPSVTLGRPVEERNFHPDLARSQPLVTVSLGGGGDGGAKAASMDIDQYLWDLGNPTSTQAGSVQGDIETKKAREDGK